MHAGISVSSRTHKYMSPLPIISLVLHAILLKAQVRVSIRIQIKDSQIPYWKLCVMASRVRIYYAGMIDFIILGSKGLLSIKVNSQSRKHTLEGISIPSNTLCCILTPACNLSQPFTWQPVYPNTQLSLLSPLLSQSPQRTLQHMQPL